MAVSVLVSFLLLASAVSSDDCRGKFIVFEACAQEHNVPQSGYIDYFNRVSVEGVSDHKCFVKCLFDKHGALNGNTIVMENLKEGIKKDWQKPEDQEKILPVLDECHATEAVLPDPCDYTFEVMDCFIKGIQEVRQSTTYITYDQRQSG